MLVSPVRDLKRESNAMSARRLIPMLTLAAVSAALVSTAALQRADPLAEPFKGITTDGRLVPGLFPIRSTGVSTRPVRVAMSRPSRWWRIQRSGW